MLKNLAIKATFHYQKKLKDDGEIFEINIREHLFVHEKFFNHDGTVNGNYDFAVFVI